MRDQKEEDHNAPDLTGIYIVDLQFGGWPHLTKTCGADALDITIEVEGMRMVLAH